MGIKEKGESLYLGVYTSVRRISAMKRRVDEFNKKDIPAVLTEEQKKDIKKYYSPYKVPKYVFHNYFTERSGKFYVEYIPQDIYVGYIDAYFNDIVAAKYFDNKCLYGSLFYGIPQCRNILMRVNHIWLDGYNRPVSKKRAEELLAQVDGGIFVKEAQITAGGTGVTYIPGDKISLNLIRQAADKIATDLVVQSELRQHADMAALNDSSVNSLRIYSLLGKDGVAKIYSSVVRMGVNGSKLDNYSAGGLTCGIQENGKLRKYGYNKNGDKIEAHPSSGQKFEDYRIPSYEEAIGLIKKAHPMVPHFRSIAWDIAIDENGTPVLIEANFCRGGIDSLQVNNGPLYGKDTKKVLDEVFGK